jgi:YD repeat-containing protein
MKLTAVTHPTNARTEYGYGQVTRNFGISGYMVGYRLEGRADIAGGSEYNAKSYTYSANNHTGWPHAQSIPFQPPTFTYYTTATEAHTGLAATTTFNYRHMATGRETNHGGAAVMSEAFEYDWLRLPSRVTTKTYCQADSGRYMQTVVAMANNSLGNVTASWSPLAGGDTSNTEHRTTYEYGWSSIPTRVTYKQGAGTAVDIRYTLNPAGTAAILEEVFVNNALRAKTGYTHDSRGNVVALRRYRGCFTQYVLTEWTYCSNDAYPASERTSGVLGADGAPATGTPGQPPGTILSLFQHDNLGRLTHYTDPNGNQTAYEYNRRGDLTMVRNPGGTSRLYTWNYVSNHVTVRDENGAQFRHAFTPLGLEREVVDVLTGSLITRKTYDHLSRLLSEEEFVYNGRVAYAYDHLGRVTSETVRQGDGTILAQTTYSYRDAVPVGGEMLQSVTRTVHGEAGAPSIVTARYTDRMGNLVRAGRFLGGIEHIDTYTYDYVGNLLTGRTAYTASLGGTFTNKFEYDHAGRVVKAVNAENNYITDTFDALGRLASTTNYAGHTSTFTYDALGRLLSEAMPIDASSNSMRKYYYDASGNITSTRHTDNTLGSALRWARTD